MKNEINLLICIDNDYINQAQCLLYSLKKHNPDIFFNIYLLYENIEKRNLKVLNDFINRIQIGKLFKYYFSSKSLNLPISINYITKETYFRLFAPFIIKENFERLLYLDCDIICDGSIEELYNEDFEDNYFIGCKNMTKKYDDDYNKAHNIVLGIEGENYINAGVLLINIEKYRKNIKQEDILLFIENNINNLKFQDQDVINRMFNNKIKIASNKYNYQINETNPGEIIYEGNSLIHYSSCIKPWNKDFRNNKAYKKFKDIYDEIKKINYEMYSLDIIIPIYNSRKTLPKTLSSIYTQEDSEFFNVYIIDDYSSENYDDILEFFKDKLKLHYYKMKENSGPGIAREIGINISSSKYITFIDSDDLLFDVNALKSLLYYAPIADVVRSVIDEELVFGYQKYINDNIGLHGKIYCRAFLKKNDIHFNNEKCNEDSRFNALIDMCGAKYIDIKNKTYMWCNNSDSLSRRNKKEYYEYDIIKYAYSISSAIEEAFYKIKDVDKITYKALPYLKDVYYRRNCCKIDESYSIIEHYMMKIYLIIKNNNIQNYLNNFLNEDSNFKEYYKGLIERYGK